MSQKSDMLASKYEKATKDFATKIGSLSDGDQNTPSGPCDGCRES